MKSIFFYLYSIYTVKKEYYYSLYYEKYQLNILKNIIANSTNTDYKTNIPDNSNTITRYQKNFELTTYESLLPFIKKIQQGKEKVLTQEKIQYLLEFYVTFERLLTSFQRGVVRNGPDFRNVIDHLEKQKERK